MIKRRFVQECFIRDTSDELIKQLECLGYEKDPHSQGELSCIRTNLIERYYNGNCLYDSQIQSYTLCDERDLCDEKDCGTNRRLFLAIAALSDNYDICNYSYEDKYNLRKAKIDKLEEDFKDKSNT